jgi:hypothetical protein
MERDPQDAVAALLGVVEKASVYPAAVAAIRQVVDPGCRLLDCERVLSVRKILELAQERLVALEDTRESEP